MDNAIKAEIRDAILYRCPKTFAHKYLYNRNHEHRINLKNPVLYDEKIHWLMIYRYDKSYSNYADKIKVREYVKACGLESILIPLEGEGVYASSKDISLDKLPNQFVLKANHGSGEKFYVICHDKKTFNPSIAFEKLDKALKINFAKHYCQYHYAGIKPALLCEKYLVTDGQNRLTDYKVVCSYGYPIAILVCRDRNNGRDYYSPTWEYLDYTKPEFRSGIIEDKPVVLDEMLNAASKLSEPFPLARVDFYIVDGRLYFGEITLTPSEGIHNNLNEKAQIELGERINISAADLREG